MIFPLRLVLKTNPITHLFLRGISIIMNEPGVIAVRMSVLFLHNYDCRQQCHLFSKLLFVNVEIQFLIECK